MSSTRSGERVQIVDVGQEQVPTSEATVRRWMSTWTGRYRIPGIAVCGAIVPSRTRGAPATETDLIVLTAQGCVVIEIKGMRTRRDGTLLCPANGPWTMPGVTDTPVHTRGNDTNPIRQVRTATLNLKETAREAGVRIFVTGLVLVVPHDKQSVQASVGTADLPTGVEVLIGDFTSLRAWFQRHRARHAKWTAGQAHHVLSALNIGHAVTHRMLLEEDLPGEPTATPEALPRTCAKSAPKSTLGDRRRCRHRCGRPRGPVLRRQHPIRPVAPAC